MRSVQCELSVIICRLGRHLQVIQLSLWYLLASLFVSVSAVAVIFHILYALIELSAPVIDECFITTGDGDVQSTGGNDHAST